MRIFIDTSVVVDIDRGKDEIIGMCRKLVEKHEVYVSTVTVSEILTGAYLRRDYRRAVSKAKAVLGQFSWVNLDGVVAERTALISAYLIGEGLPVEYQDVAIAASFLIAGGDYLITHNKEHFERIPALKGKVILPTEFISRFL